MIAGQMSAHKKISLARHDILRRIAQGPDTERSGGGRVGPLHDDAAPTKLPVPFGQDSPDSIADAGSHAGIRIDTGRKFEHRGSQKAGGAVEDHELAPRQTWKAYRAHGSRQVGRRPGAAAPPRDIQGGRADLGPRLERGRAGRACRDPGRLDRGVGAAARRASADPPGKSRGSDFGSDLTACRLTGLLCTL